MNGIEREVDNLGRVVIPINFREKLGIEANTKLLVSMEKGNIIMVPVKECCALCLAHINKEAKIRLCNRCIEKVKEI